MDVDDRVRELPEASEIGKLPCTDRCTIYPYMYFSRGDGSCDRFWFACCRFVSLASRSRFESIRRGCRFMCPAPSLPPGVGLNSPALCQWPYCAERQAILQMSFRFPNHSTLVRSTEDPRNGRGRMTPGSRGSRESRDQSDDAAFQFGTQDVSLGVSILFENA